MARVVVTLVMTVMVTRAWSGVSLQGIVHPEARYARDIQPIQSSPSDGEQKQLGKGKRLNHYPFYRLSSAQSPELAAELSRSSGDDYAGQCDRTDASSLNNNSGTRADNNNLVPADVSDWRLYPVHHGGRIG